jgi:hypothetical protein
MQTGPVKPPDLPDTLALLAQTPATLHALLRPLPAVWTESNEGASHDGKATWSAREVIAHLVDCEHTNWLPRARSIRESNGAIRPFPPFVRRVGSEDDKTKPLAYLLDAFAEIRIANLAEVESWRLTACDLEGQAIHPVFGPVTLGQLLATWATHDLTHLHQITRTLAHQQRQAVGPWIQYLGVLHCNGHSE